MKVVCQITLDVKNAIIDEEQLADDLDDTLGEFVMNNEQTYFASSKISVKTSNVKKISEVQNDTGSQAKTVAGFK